MKSFALIAVLATYAAAADDVATTTAADWEDAANATMDAGKDGMLGDTWTSMDHSQSDPRFN